MLPKRQQMSNKSKAFKDLQNSWYKKLEKLGFQDIEQSDGNLKRWHGQDFKAIHATAFEYKAEYYRAAGYFLNHYQFASKREKLIWELHSQGVSNRDIAKILKKKGVKRMAKDVVRMLIKRLVKEMMLLCP